MIETVLIPTDGSDQVEPAVEYGLNLAEAFDAEVHALYVVETEASYILSVGLGDEEMEEYREYGEETVTAVVDRASERGLDAVGAINTGNVPQKIVEYADDHDIDHVVMGGQGRGAIERYLGSTADKVLRMTNRPVTVLSPETR